MILALKASSSDENYAPIDLATVVIDPAYAAHLLQLMSKVAEISQTFDRVLALDVWDYVPEWYENAYGLEDEGVEELLDKIAEDDVVELPAVPHILDRLYYRDHGPSKGHMEYGKLRVYANEVRWEAQIKYTSVTYETAAVSKALLERAQAEVV